MNTKARILSIAVIFLSVTLNAQETGNKSHIWSFEGKKIKSIGTYISLSGTYSPLNNNDAYWLGGRIGLVFNDRWTIGIGGNALDYDHQLTTLVNDGTYRLQAAYGGMFIEHLIPLKDWGKFGVSWLSGKGLTYFQYDKEYAESRSWYDEIIDVEDFAVNELGVEFQIRVYKNWWLGAQASYRLTSPIELEGENDYFLKDYSAGISVKWGLF